MAADIRQETGQLSTASRLDKLISTYAPDAAWLAVIVTIVFALGGVSAGGDMFWQQKTGEWILAHHTVPHQALFAPYAQGQPWVVQEWFSHVLLAFTAHLSPAAPYLLMDSVVAISAVLAYLRVRRFKTATAAAIAAFLVILASFLSGFWTWRTWWWSVLLIQLELLILEGHTADPKRPLWPLLPVMVIWANLHAQVLFGVIVLVLYAVTVAPKKEVATRNRTWIWCGIATATTLLNPNGIQVLTYAFEHGGTSSLMTNNISEWLSVNTHQLSGKVVVAAIALAAFLLIRTKRNVPQFSWLLFVGFAALSLYQLRNYLTFAFAVLPQAVIIALSSANQTKRISIRVSQRRRIFVSSVFLALSIEILTSAVPQAMASGLQSQEKTYPTAAVDWLESHPIQGPLLNEYPWGGYLIYRNIPVFIDGRADIYLKNGVFKDYMDMWQLQPDTPQLLSKYGFTRALLPPVSQLTTYLKGIGWQQIYADKTAVILRKP